MKMYRCSYFKQDFVLIKYMKIFPLSQCKHIIKMSTPNCAMTHLKGISEALIKTVEIVPSISPCSGTVVLLNTQSVLNINYTI